MLERAKELRRQGEAARRKDREAARRYYEEAVELLRGCGDPQLLAHTVRHLGDVYFESGDTALAEPCLAEALEIYRADPVTPRLQLANSIRSMALCGDMLGSDSRALWLEARELYEMEGIDAGIEECSRRIA